MAKVKYVKGSKVPKAKSLSSSSMGNVKTDELLNQSFLSSIGKAGSDLGTTAMGVGSQAVPSANLIRVPPEGLNQQQTVLEMNKEKQKAMPVVVAEKPKKPMAKVTKKKAKDLQSMIDEVDTIGLDAFKAKYAKKK